MTHHKWVNLPGVSPSQNRPYQPLRGTVGQTEARAQPARPMADPRRSHPWCQW